MGLLQYELATGKYNPIPGKRSSHSTEVRVLAVLGDQKNGRNLEAPEGVIKDIIDDAFARHQQNSTGNVRFTAQINRRTVFDEIIEEAKLRQSTSGRNPFELA